METVVYQQSLFVAGIRGDDCSRDDHSSTVDCVFLNELVSAYNDIGK